MPTIMSHAAVPLALGLGLGRGRVPFVLLGAGIFASMLPDLDVLAFRFGIPYADTFGHRGASHALATAALIGALAAAALRPWRIPAARVFVFVSLAAASHGLLDTLTDGGHGVALLWPWSEARFFAPVRPIEVSPIGVGRFLSARGAAVLASETLWVWGPCALLACAVRPLRQRDGSRDR